MRIDGSDCTPMSDDQFDAFVYEAQTRGWPWGRLPQVTGTVMALREDLSEARAWLNTITGAAFFGTDAPDKTSMQFTITLNAAEWREMRAIVERGGQGVGNKRG